MKCDQCDGFGKTTTEKGEVVLCFFCDGHGKLCDFCGQHKGICPKNNCMKEDDDERSLPPRKRP